MNHKQITEKYYSKWIGWENILNSESCGVKFCYSQERNKVQYGYSQSFDLYVFIQDDRIIFSYGDKIIDKISDIQKRICKVLSPEGLKQLLNSMFNNCIRHNVKYVFDESLNLDIKLKSRTLDASEYPKYLEFYRKIHPNCKQLDWLQNYFTEMVNENLCCGLFDNDVLVCCSNAPGMPYMQEIVQEIGINTLDNFKKKGYATDVCLSCVREIIKNGKSPQWSTTIDNIASQKLAKKIGFVKFADILTLTL